MKIWIILLLLLVISVSCINRESVTTVYNVDKASMANIDKEGTIVFVRPETYSVFGTKSLREYIEIVYENVSRNEAGLLQVDIGIRNRGGQWYYDTVGPDFPLSLKTNFYEKPFSQGTSASVPVYETNWQMIKLLRGATEHYKVICPIKSATYYQITISELIK